METRVAIVGIIVENMESVKYLNDILHEYRNYIIERLGLPYPKKHVNFITVVVDAPQDIINALSGKIGKLSGITAKTISSNTKSLED